MERVLRARRPATAWALAALVLVLGAALIPLALIVWVRSGERGPRLAVAECGSFLVPFIPAAVLAYLVMGLIWPWSVLAPLNPLLLRRRSFAELREASPVEETGGGAPLCGLAAGLSFTIPLLSSNAAFRLDWSKQTTMAQINIGASHEDLRRQQFGQLPEGEVGLRQARGRL